MIVAVTDSGVQFDHEDLAANMWVNEAELNGTEGVDDAETAMWMTYTDGILSGTAER